MARVGTTFLNIGKWLDGENPGSGPQDGTLSDGLNGDKNKIDIALGTGHNTDGTHKAGVIDAANLAATTVDGSSLEQDAQSKKLRIKDGGVSSAKLADDSVTKEKIAADVVSDGLAQAADGSIYVNAKSEDFAFTNGVLELASPSSDHVAIPLVFSSATAIPARATPTFAIPAGVLTKVMVVMAAGGVSTGNFTVSIPSVSALKLVGDGQGVVSIWINGVPIGLAVAVDDGDPATAIVLIEL